MSEIVLSAFRWLSDKQVSQLYMVLAQCIRTKYYVVVEAVKVLKPKVFKNILFLFTYVSAFHLGAQNAPTVYCQGYLFIYF